jgi:hypothetical protein
MVVADGAGRAPGGESAALSPCTGKSSERTRYQIAKPIMAIKARRADVRGLSFDDRGRRHRIAGASIQVT